MGVKLHFFQNNLVSSGHSWEPENANPYGAGVLANLTTAAADVSSIPTPYARLELFNQSFELAINPDADAVYRKCVAHCLDVFEILFYYGKDELAKKHISIEFHNYEGNDPATTPNNKTYFNALRAYRNTYGLQHFKHFYLMKWKSKIIASTSHLTGFFCPANVPELQFGEIAYFIEKENDTKKWRSLADRDEHFQRFIYELFRALNLGQRFQTMNNYIQTALHDKIGLWTTAHNNDNINTLYPEFNVLGGITNASQMGLVLETRNPSCGTIYVLCDGYDKCYLKYLLFPNDAKITFQVDKGDYDIDVSRRKNPIDKQQDYPWIGVNDLLGDNMLSLFGQANAEYYFTFDIDADNPEVSRANFLVPFTKEFFRYFKKEQIGSDVTYSIREIKSHDNRDCYDVTLKIPVRGNYKVSLTRRYSFNPKGNEGKVMQMDLDVAIYPFVKAVDNNGQLLDNFYRIMMCESGGKKIDESSVSLYMVDTNGFISNTSKIENQNGGNVFRTTTTLDSHTEGYKILNTNIVYIALDSKYVWDNNGNMVLSSGVGHPLAMDLLEFGVIQTKGDSVYKFVLAPRIPERTCPTTNPLVAVDLGTSNTFVAIQYGGNPPEEFNTKNDTLQTDKQVELIHLTKPDSSITDSKKRYDSGTFIHQIPEFIPSFFQTGKGYEFPVPTKLNLRQISRNDIRSFSSKGHPLTTLLDVNIPFAAYAEGLRRFGNTMLDKHVSDFKWFDAATDLDKSNEYSIFIDQLCFMVRAHLIMNGCDPRTTELTWTYPLAFDAAMINFIKEKWELTYQKYFCSTAPAPELPNRPITCVSESRTPLLNADAAAKDTGLKVSVDIGGGTSDVLVFTGNNIHGETVNVVDLATSFRFAGKHLFAATGTVTNGQNCWFKAVQNTPGLLPVVGQDGDGLSNTKISTNVNGTNIDEVMDYVFSLNQGAKLNAALNDNKIARIVTFHNAALIYRIATLCKQVNNGQMPELVNFSGNGSRLLMIHRNATNDREAMLRELVQRVFKKVYGVQQGPAIFIEQEPKKTTALGAIKGHGVLVGNVNFGTFTKRVEDDANRYAMPFGANLYWERTNIVGQSGLPNKNSVDKVEIKKMVTDFLEFYYGLIEGNGIYGGINFNIQDMKNFITDDKINKGLEQALNSVGSEVNDSIFLGIVSYLITQLVKQ